MHAHMPYSPYNHKVLLEENENQNIFYSPLKVETDHRSRFNRYLNPHYKHKVRIDIQSKKTMTALDSLKQIKVCYY